MALGTALSVGPPPQPKLKYLNNYWNEEWNITVINPNDFGNPPACLAPSPAGRYFHLFSEISKIKELNGTSSCEGIHGSQMTHNDLSI